MAESTPKVRRCPRCKNPIESESQGCPSCGYLSPVARQQSASQEAATALPPLMKPTVTKTTTQPTGPWIGFAIFLGLIAFGFALAGYNMAASSVPVVNGDAYNYIIASIRGTCTVGIGIIFALAGCAVLLMAPRRTA